MNSNFFVTWDEVASYIEGSKGLKYLDAPKQWVEAFEEAIGDAARYVGDNTFYNPYGFYSVKNWLTEGELIAPSVEGGLKSIPSVTNVITDTVTGGTVAGSAALATEAVGTTITLTAAGWIATGLVGLGLGVASYELAPEFWTDVSNAVFEPITGEHLTPEQTEPFLRKKISTLLSTDDNGHIVTYIDRDMMERMYNFIQTHVQQDGWNFYDVTSPYVSGSWASYTPSYTYYGGAMEKISHNSSAPRVEIPVKTGISLTDAMLQSVVHQVQLMMEVQGYTDSEPSVSGVVNNLRSLYPNYNNADFYAVNYTNYYTSSTVQVRKVQITGYNVTTTDDSEITAKWDNNGVYEYDYYRYLRMGVNQAQAENDDYGTRVELYDKDGNFINSQTDALFSYEYDITTGVGTVKDDGTSYIFTRGFWLGYVPNFDGQTNKFGCYYTSVEPRGALDNYLTRNGVEQKGKIPPTSGTMALAYPEWYAGNKTIGTPTKGGEDAVSNYIPANIPMTATDTEKIIKKGVNKGSDSYTDDQDSNQTGKDTPNINPIDAFNESVQDNINDYNESNTSPNTAPDPSPQPLPDYPTTPPTDTEGDSGDTPTPGTMETVTASGMVSVYNPTKQELIDFSAWLWSPNFLDNFLKIFANPMDAIIGLHIMYATPSTGNSEHIVAGYLDSGVSAKVVNNQFTEIDCGTVEIPEYYGSAIDYEPYVQIHVYLPFVGIQAIKPNDVIGKQLNIKYGVDALTGTCLATLTSKKGSSEIACYNFAGNCATQVPVSGGNYAQMITGLASMAVGVGGAIATGNPIMLAGAAVGAMSSHLDVSHSGSIGANAGAMGIRKPYVIITRKKSFDAGNYNSFYGFPANHTIILGSCSGYTQVKSVHIDSIPVATDNEKTEIETLLKQGVIIR